MADLLLNHNLGAEELRYEWAPWTRPLLGHRYALIRRSFRLARDAPTNGATGAAVAILMGGSDPTAQTAKVVRGLRLLTRSDLRVSVAIGGASPYEADARAEAGADRRFNFLLDPPDVADLLAGADVVISAAGTSVWELCCVRAAMLLVTVADNQQGVAQKLEDVGAAMHLGWYADVTSEAIADAVDGLLNDPVRRDAMRRQAGEAVDGVGSDRVVNMILGETAA